MTELADRTDDALRRARALLAGAIDMDTSSVTEVIHAALIDTFAEDRGVDVPIEDVCLQVTSDDEEQAAYMLGRMVAETADVLVTTHAMTATALALRTVPGADKMDQYRVLVVDEADRWANAAESVSFSFVSCDAVERSIHKLIQVVQNTRTAQPVSVAAAKALDAVERLRRRAPHAELRASHGRRRRGGVDRLARRADHDGEGGRGGSRNHGERGGGDRRDRTPDRSCLAGDSLDRGILARRACLVASRGQTRSSGSVGRSRSDPKTIVDARGGRDAPRAVCDPDLGDVGDSRIWP